MRSKQMKKMQKEITHVIHKFNKMVAEDSMFRGRVEMRQINARWEKFDDNSGYMASFLVAVVDKDTGASFCTWIDYSYHFLDYHFWKVMNDALVDIFDVWHVGELKKDFTKVKVKEVDFYSAPYISHNFK